MDSDFEAGNNGSQLSPWALDLRDARAALKIAMDALARISDGNYWQRKDIRKLAEDTLDEIKKLTGK